MRILIKKKEEKKVEILVRIEREMLKFKSNNLIKTNMKKKPVK